MEYSRLVHFKNLKELILAMVIYCFYCLAGGEAIQFLDEQPEPALLSSTPKKGIFQWLFQFSYKNKKIYIYYYFKKINA